jgi:hypothetical protein
MLKVHCFACDNEIEVCTFVWLLLGRGACLGIGGGGGGSSGGCCRARFTLGLALDGAEGRRGGQGRQTGLALSGARGLILQDVRTDVQHSAQQNTTTSPQTSFSITLVCHCEWMKDGIKTQVIHVDKST